MKSFKTLLIENYFQIICLAAFSILVFVLLRNIPVGIESINRIRVFNNDEARGVELVQRCLLKNNFDPFYYYLYGMFYYSVSIVALKIFFLFTDHSVLSVSTIALTMRLVSLTSFVLFAVVFFRLCRIFLSKEWSWLCVLSVVSLNSFAQLAQLIHADMLQILLVTLSFYLVLKNHSFTCFLIAECIAGVAFGTKYNAVFCLPFLFLPYLLENYFFKNDFTLRKTSILVFKFLLGCLMFSAGWLIFNPYSAIDYKNSLTSILVQSHMANSGIPQFVSSGNSFLWFSIFVNEIPIISLLILCIGLLFLILQVSKSKFKIDNKNIFTIAVYCFLSFLYLFLFVKHREIRYSFHFLPLLFLLLFLYFEKFYQQYLSRFRIALPVLLVAFVSTTLISAKSLSADHHKLSNPLLKSGNILANNFSKDKKIYADFYSFIPEGFSEIQIDWLVNKNSLTAYNPDIIILNSKCSGKKVWKKKEESISQLHWTINHDYLPSVIQSQKDFYNFILKENSSYKIFYEDDDLIIFSKKE